MENEFRYGDDNTIHRTEKVNIQTDSQGRVVGVWFRCMLLPFDQTLVSDTKAKSLEKAYADVTEARGIKAIVFDGAPV